MGFNKIPGDKISDHNNLENIQGGISGERYHLTEAEKNAIGGGGSVVFTGLTDTPNDYAGQAGKAAVVNVTETGLEFGAMAGGSGYTVVNHDLKDPWNGTETTWTLTFTPDFTNHTVIMSMDGIRREVGVDFTVVGNVITFNNPPQNFAEIFEIYSDVATAAEIKSEEETNWNGTDTAWTLGFTPDTNYPVLVYKEGVLCELTEDYTLAGNVITFVVAPVNWTKIINFHNVSSAPVTDHSQLTNLDYDTSGHTGFTKGIPESSIIGGDTQDPNDLISIWDASVSGYRKQSRSDFLSGISSIGPTGYTTKIIRLVSNGIPLTTESSALTGPDGSGKFTYYVNHNISNPTLLRSLKINGYGSLMTASSPYSYSVAAYVRDGVGTSFDDTDCIIVVSSVGGISVYPTTASPFTYTEYSGTYIRCVINAKVTSVNISGSYPVFTLEYFPGWVSAWGYGHGTNIHDIMTELMVEVIY